MKRPITAPATENGSLNERPVKRDSTKPRIAAIAVGIKASAAPPPTTNSPYINPMTAPEIAYVLRPGAVPSRPKSKAESMGEKVKALKVEIAIAKIIVAANCL